MMSARLVYFFLLNENFICFKVLSSKLFKYGFTLDPIKSISRFIFHESSINLVSTKTTNNLFSAPNKREL